MDRCSGCAVEKPYELLKVSEEDGFFCYECCGESEPLLACPFCGGEASIADAEEAGDSAKVVYCTSCGASSKVIFALKCDVDAQLIETWNRRTSAAVD